MHLNITRKYKRITALLLAAVLCLSLFGSVSTAALGSARAENELLTGKTSNEVVAMMGLGFNIGNTFDATGGNLETRETNWGNAKVTQAFVDAIYDAGFDTVRLPVTWSGFISSDGTYTVNPDYLARIKEVVDYCYNDGLFVILNAHHEGWINRKDLDTAYVEVGKELAAVWTQVATYFADYDQHLIFEGMNEPRMAGTPTEWNGSDEGSYAVNYLNQVFVNAVRGTGLGRNDERCLMIPGYAAASSTAMMRNIAMPLYNGQVAANLIVSVHSYTPYEFCLTDQKKTFLTGIDTGSIDAVFRDINNIFLQNNIPVIIGETGATNSGGNTKDRAAWAEYTAKKAASYGIPIILWDNGASGSVGGECHSYINRRTCQVNFPEIFEALHRGWDSVTRGAVRKAASLPRNGGFLGGRILFEEAYGADSATLKGEIKASSLPDDGTISVLFRGAEAPYLELCGDALFIGRDTSDVTDYGGYKIARFKLGDFIADIESLSGSVTDIHTVLVTNREPSITVYEISVQGLPETKEGATATYRVNGISYASSADGMPKTPTPENLRFLGWYTSPCYAPGTEFNGTLPEGVRTIYGKCELSSFTLPATELTPAALPVISPRTDRPLPSPTPTPSPEITETPTPTPAPTAEPVSSTPTPTPVPEDLNFNPIVICLLLAFAVGMIAFGVFLVIRGILRR